MSSFPTSDGGEFTNADEDDADEAATAASTDYDLRHWDYLTKTFDREDFFSHSPGDANHQKLHSMDQLAALVDNAIPIHVDDSQYLANGSVASDPAFVRHPPSTSLHRNDEGLDREYYPTTDWTSAHYAANRGSNVHHSSSFQHSSTVGPKYNMHQDDLELRWNNNSSARKSPAQDVPMHMAPPLTHWTNVATHIPPHARTSSSMISQNHMRVPRPSTTMVHGNSCATSCVQAETPDRAHHTTNSIASNHTAVGGLEVHVPSRSHGPIESSFNAAYMNLLENNDDVAIIPGNDTAHDRSSREQQPPREVTTTLLVHPPSHSDNVNVSVQRIQITEDSTSISDVARAATNCKPLSAYNYFFRDERDNILLGMKNPTDPFPSPVNDFSERKRDALLHQRWNVDPALGRRKHRKIHGKISLVTLTQEIASRWRNLPESGRAFYHSVSKADKDHFERIMGSVLRPTLTETNP